MPRGVHLMQKMRCIKLIMNWRSSSDKQTAGDRPKVSAKVDMKELAIKKN